MTGKIEKDLVLVKDIYKKTPYSQEYLSLLCRKGRVKAEKIGRKWFISKTALEEYIKEQGIPIFLAKESVSKSKLRHPIKPEILLTSSAVIAPPRPQIDFPEEIKIIKPEEEIREKPEQIIQRKDVEDIKGVLDRFLKIIEARLFPKFFTFKPTARAIVLGCLMAGGLLGFAFANGGYQYAQGKVQEIKTILMTLSLSKAISRGTGRMIF